MIMCSRSVSGSSLLSGYNEDDARETNGRSRREFEEIDAVLYNEEKAKLSSIKRICEEWASRPHFRVRGRVQHIEKQPPAHLIQSHRLHDVTHFDTTGSSSSDLFVSNSKVSNSNEVNVLVNSSASGRSSINSIERFELTNNSDLDDNNVTDTVHDDHSSEAGADSFDTDDDDDENNSGSSEISTDDQAKQRHGHSKNHPQLLIKCMKDSIVNSLATKLLQRFLSDQQSLFQRYGKLVCERNSIKLRSKLRPNSLPPHSMSQNRFSYPSVTNTHLPMMTTTPYRSTPDPDMKGLLLVTRLHTTNSNLTTNTSASPRKSRIPPPERIPTSLSIDKRNPQEISLIGTAVATSPSTQLAITMTTQSSQNQIRQTSSTYRYRSATTLHTEPNTRLPPINIERLVNNDQTTINRSNTTTTSSTIMESIPPATRAVSGTSIGSNPSAPVKLRLPSNAGKLQRTSRPLSISSINNNKDFNNLSSTSPTRSIIATTPGPSSSLRTTTASRTQLQQHQKRPLLTTKTRPPPSPTVLKLSAAHIW